MHDATVRFHLPQFNSNLIRSILLALVMLPLVCSMKIFAGQSNNNSQQPAVSPRERAMNAAEQLRVYRQRVQTEQHLKEYQRGISSAPREVGITINKSAQTASTIFFYDNVEGGLNGWTTEAYTGADIWHQSALQASSPTHSWWPGIDIQSDYNNGARINGAAKTPAISLVGATGPIKLMFAENYMTEQGWDYCMVDVSSDGGTTWNHLRGGYGVAPTGDSRGWTISSLDLTAYANQNINLRFYFDTGDALYNDFPGWFVDDIVVFDQGGIIEGKKIFDVNNNGVKDVGERGVKDWMITATGPITITTKTNARGHYLFTLPLGSYTVTETFQPNWTQKFPPSGHWDINLATPDTVVDSVHFGNYTQASFINGMKFNDLNRNGTFDAGDSVISDWKILLTDTSGNQIDFDYTDSLGQYSLYVFNPGRYIVKEVGREKWVQSYPPSESYTIDIPDLNTVSNGNDFGNYFSDSANTIMGMKFNDVNRNHQLDAHEAGVLGFSIKITGPKTKTVKTDSSGFFAFHGLHGGTYKIREIPQMGWWQSYPDSYYTVTCFNGQLIDTINFGNYEITAGSISGVKFHDLNGNGVKDSNETGLSGWHILLNGTTYFGSIVNQSSTTDGSGNYSFTGVWPGSYTVSEVWKNGWTQTYPAGLSPYHINLAVEESRTGVDFGNIDSVLTIGTYRTFMPESLALAIDQKGKHVPVKLKPNGIDFEYNLLWYSIDSAVTLKLTFSVATTGTLSGMNYESDLPVFHDSLGSWTDAKDVVLHIPPAGWHGGPTELTWPYLHVTGHSIKGKPVKLKYKSTYGGAVSKGVLPGSPANPVADSIITMRLTYPMPNAINMLEVSGAGLAVGLGGPHSVVHLNYKDIVKSLVEKGNRMHLPTSVARCLDKFAGTNRSIKKQQRNLTPTKGNNKLFAEMVALKANILGSDFGAVPAGFGNLIFDEGNGTGPAHPLNGLPIRTIAAEADSFMSSYRDTIGEMACKMPPGLYTMDPESLFAKIRMIDSAFSGPLDTISFATGLEFKGVRQISAVPYLRYDPVMAQKSFSSWPKTNYLPEQFSLSQNYPNPFNPTTTIQFNLTQPSFVTLKIYNILGQEVVSLLDHESMDDGEQEVMFNANNLPSGVYFYRLMAQGVPDEDGTPVQSFSAVKKMLLLK